MSNSYQLIGSPTKSFDGSCTLFMVSNGRKDGWCAVPDEVVNADPATRHDLGRSKFSAFHSIRSKIVSVAGQMIDGEIGFDATTNAFLVTDALLHGEPLIRA